MQALSTLVRSSKQVGLAIAASALLAVSAQAAVITSMSGGTAIIIPLDNANAFTGGPVSNPGYTFTSSNSTSVHGYDGGYGLADNNSWDAGLGYAQIGLNAANGFMRMTFDSAVSSVLAFVNYAAGPNGSYDFGGTPSIAVYDSSNVLIESFDLFFATPLGNNLGFDFGFSEGSAIIKSIEFSNSFIVAANLRIDGQAVPEPGTLALLGAALAALALGRRKQVRA